LNKKIYTESVFLIFLGILTSLSLPPYNYFIINFLTFTSFFLFLIKKSNQLTNRKLFFIYGWLFGFGYFATNLYWISISLTFDQNFKFLIPLTLILIPSFLAIFHGLVTYFFLIFKPKKIISSFFLFSLIFGVLEFVRGSILTGFPWNLIAYSFSNQLEVLSITSIIGSYGFNLFCISLFTSPAMIVLRNKIQNILVSIFFLISVIFLFIHGSFYKEKFNKIALKNYGFKVRAVSSNISLDRFYKNLNPASVIKDLIDISDPIDNEKIIFVWPEGILPDISQDNLIDFKFLFDEKFTKNHLLIIGTNSQSTDKGIKKYYNTFSIYDNELNIINYYNKIKLVPFGEFLPFENILSLIGLKSLTNNYQSFSSGDQRNIINLAKQNFSLKILPLICYEIIYSGKLFHKTDFDLIINISEDGWFGQSIGPEQHFVHSIFRAIESGKYVVRSANNGIAAIINPLGIIEKKVNFGQTGYIDLESNKKIQPTLFSKYGNKVFGLLILLYIFLIFSFNRIKNE
jgi:apolipoprotein N-acyltransferase